MLLKYGIKIVLVSIKANSSRALIIFNNVVILSTRHMFKRNYRPIYFKSVMENISIKYEKQKEKI
jgi:hypothetical protein